MKGTILNFRQGKTTKYDNQMIVAVPGITKREDTKKVIGKKITWKSPAGKAITGTLTYPHGNKGALRAHFEKGMPGQAIGTAVEVH